MTATDRPLFTEEYEGLTSLTLAPRSTFLYARSDEPRSEVEDTWIMSHPDSRFLALVSQDDEQQEIVLDVGGLRTVHLRSEEERTLLVEALRSDRLYIDITGLNHATWAPILKSAIEQGQPTTVIYQEPEAYKARRGTEQQTRFELSEGRALGPLPGFERYEPTVSTITFGSTVRHGRLLVLMGFEGDRFGHLLSDQDFDPDQVFPVLGMPGFRIEFVAHALLGNERPLTQVLGQARLRYAAAHCPFTLAYLVEDMLEEDRTGSLTIAPIGTKPHALGAVLSAIAAPERIEIIYDHPNKKKGRSHGKGRTFTYDVTAFLNQWPLPTRTDITHLQISPRRW